MHHDSEPDPTVEIVRALGLDRALGRLLDDLKDMVIVLDTSFTLVYVNRTCTEVLGWEADALVSESLLGTVHPDDMDKVIGSLRTAGEGDDGALEVRSRDEHGNYHWYSWRASRSGDLILAIGRDATPQRNMYDELADRTAFIDSVLDTMSSGVITVDEAGIILSANRAALSMFGYDRDALLGRHASVLFDPYEGAFDVRASDAADEPAPAGPAPINTSLSGRLGRRGNGTTFPVGLEVDTFESGGSTYFTGVVTDLTDLTDAFRELDDARRAADAANQQKSALLAQVSHELRTPLNAVLGFSELIAIDDDGRHGTAIASIRESGLKLLDMINEILDLNAAGSTEGAAATESVALADVVDGAVAALTLTSSDRISIRHTSPEHAVVFTERDRLREVVRRALDFALATASGHEPITVGVQPATDSGYACRIEVSIPGLGLPTDRAHRVFEPFGTRHLLGSAAAGQGLGLAIAARHVESMGGAVGVDTSTPGRTVLRLEFPLIAAIPSTAVSS